MPERAVGPFGPAELWPRMREVSGDTNPLHLDAESARKVGLAAPPVHGMLLLACFEPALQEWRPDLGRAPLGPVHPAGAPRRGGHPFRRGLCAPPAADKPQILMRLIAKGASRAPASSAEAVLGAEGPGELMRLRPAIDPDHRRLQWHRSCCRARLCRAGPAADAGRPQR